MSIKARYYYAVVAYIFYAYYEIHHGVGMPTYSAIAMAILYLGAYMLFSFMASYYLYVLKLVNSYFQYVVMIVGPFLVLLAPIFYNYSVIHEDNTIGFILLMYIVPALMFGRQQCCLFWEELAKKERLAGRRIPKDVVSTRLDIVPFELAFWFILCIPFLVSLKWFGKLTPL
ncbi:hypothetical protein ACFL0R_01710 [Pseudomonadota bacterium]